ncbi:MAG: class I SAM-dependent methyltransferase [Pseudomonadota bacterium]
MTHVYNDTFFDYIDGGARRSASVLVGMLSEWLSPDSVLDLGCGRGVWLDEWHKAGAHDILGVDGDYVNPDNLSIPANSFLAGDLTKPIELPRRFSLAQSLEVGEHLPTCASDALVESLTSAADRVLFSSAVVGQGGEFHINEQPLSFWQKKFAERGYRAYDCLRPKLAGINAVEPWYRYNSILYVNDAGATGLPDQVTQTAIENGQDVTSAGDWKWRVRRNVVRHLPRKAVTRIAQMRSVVIAAQARKLGPC